MLETVKRHWNEFKQSEPGRRFRERYKRRRERTGGGFAFSRVAMIVGGFILAAAGLFFLPAPGPGTLILALGLGLIGAEIKPVAVFLDKSELFLRRLFSRRPR